MTFKEKLENFFYYYKWHTIIAVIAVALIGYCVHSSLTSHEPDVYISYVSDVPVSSDTASKMEKSLAENSLMKDVNGDGVKRFLLDPTVVSMDTSDGSDYAILQKLQVNMFAGSQTLMLVHKYVVEDYDGAYEDMSAFAEYGETIVGEENFPTAVSVAGNKYLEDMGINTENLYLAIHRRTEKDVEKGERNAEYALAYDVAKFILEN